MKSEKNSRSDLGSQIHAQRFLILQEYLLLYGDKLKGKASLHELFTSDAINISSEQGEAYMESIMEVEQYERQLAEMLKKQLAQTRRNFAKI